MDLAANLVSGYAGTPLACQTILFLRLRASVPFVSACLCLPPNRARKLVLYEAVMNKGKKGALLHDAELIA